MWLQLSRARSAGVGCVVAVIVVVAWSSVAVADDEDALWKITTDSLVYSDTDNVLVVSPQVAVHRTIDEDGGEVSARVVVDAVSAASVDVVSQATKRFFEIRTEVDLAIAKSFGAYLPSVSYRYSHEPDYVSHGIGLGIQRDLGSKDTTLALGYNLSLDQVGYTGTPRSAFSESLTSRTGWLSLTQVLGPKTLMRAVYTLSFQNGYMEKPYRFVPLFDAAGIAAAANDGVRLSLDTFDRYRLPLRPPEQVPDTRWGHAFGLRGMRYLGWLPGALHLDYQFFFDTWGVLAHTVEPSIHWKLGQHNTLTAYGRYYRQTGASFWAREYVVQPGDVPRYRTIDRDLSDYSVVTGGGRWERRGDLLTLYADLGAMETYYDNYLYLDQRFALVAQLGARLAL